MGPADNADGNGMGFRVRISFLRRAAICLSAAFAFSTITPAAAQKKEKAPWKPAVAPMVRPEVVVADVDKEIVSVDLPAGIEGRILAREKLFDREWLRVVFLNGAYRGQFGWFPFRASGSKVRLYALEDSQSFQTIDLNRAKFARTAAATKGYLDFRYSETRDRSQELDISSYTVDFFSYYPRSNFGLEEIVGADGINRACPDRPKQRNGSPCLEAPAKFQLPPHLKRAVAKAAKEEKVHPALVAAILQKESYFNPFSENQYEKNLCHSARKTSGASCTDYRWGQGLAQVGATNAKTYGLTWREKVVRPRQCGRKHIFAPSCFTALEKHCSSMKKKLGLPPAYCAVAGIQAVAKHVAELQHQPRWMRVDIRTESGTQREQLIDARKVYQGSLAEEFRYILGMYNRGARPMNSIEEHYRQHGTAPSWYDHAWTTERVEGATPSVQMGYLLLNREVINRCHVWQLTGLCGDSLKGTLAGAYLEDFPGVPVSSRRPAQAESSGEARPADFFIEEISPEMRENPDLNIDPDLE